MEKVTLKKTHGSVVEKWAEKPTYGRGDYFTIGTSILGFNEAHLPQWSTLTVPLTNPELLTGDWAKGPAETGETSRLVAAFSSEPVGQQPLLMIRSEGEGNGFWS